MRVELQDGTIVSWLLVWITIGPKLKLIYTRATLHTVSITVESLCTYKLFGRTYGGKFDEDINDHN